MSRSEPVAMRLLPLIRTFRALHGFSPTNRELMMRLGLRSVSTVNHDLSLLRDQGYVIWESGQPRTLRLTEKGEQWVIEHSLLSQSDEGGPGADDAA